MSFWLKDREKLSKIVFNPIKIWINKFFKLKYPNFLYFKDNRKMYAVMNENLRLKRFIKKPTYSNHEENNNNI